MQVPVHATQRGKLETPIPSILCKAAEFKPPRFSQAGTAAQAVLGGRGGQNQRLLTGLERWILGGGGRVGRSLCGCIKVKLETSVQREMARCMCTHGSRASIPDPRPEPEGCPPRTPVPHRHIGCSRGAEHPISEARPSAKSFVLASPLARIAVITCQQVPLPGSPPATLHTGRRAPPKGSVATLRPALRPRLQPPLQSLDRGVTWAWAGIPSSPCPPQVLPSLHPCSPWQALRRPWPLSFLACPLRGVTYPVLTCPANVYLSFTTQPRSEAAFLCSPLGGT